MASLAQNGDKGSKSAKAPISRHPAFPFIVALWFAALLGVGSMVVPVPVIERLVSATHLSAIVPATAPPLGFTARLLIALGFTFGGAIAGLLLARQVAKAHAPQPVATPRFSQTVAEIRGRKPISAHDELGEMGLDGSPSRGRRALAMEEDDGPSDFLDLVPLPGGTAAHHVDPFFADEIDAAADAPEDFDALELSESDIEADAAVAEDDIVAFVPPAPVASPAPAAEPGFTFDEAALDETSFDEAWVDDDADEADDAESDFADFAASSPQAPARQEFIFDASATESFAPPMADDQEEEEEAGDDALAFSPPSLAREFDPPAHAAPAVRVEFSAGPSFAEQPAVHHAVADEEDDFADDDDFAGDEFADDDFAGEAPVNQFHAFSSSPFIAEEPEAEAHEAVEAPAFDDAPLEDLGLVQLAQRLGSSIEKRREYRAALAASAASAAAAAATVATPASRLLVDDEEIAAPDDVANAMSAWFSSAAPEAAEDMAEEEDEGEADYQVEDEAAQDFAPPAAEAPRQTFQPLPEEPAPAPFNPLPGLASIDIGEEDDDDIRDDDLSDLAASFSLPLSNHPAFSQPAPAPAPAFVPVAEEVEELEEEAEDEGGAGNFASLLEASNPFRNRAQEFVRIEDEPVADDGVVEPAVVFPSEAPVARTAPVAAPAIPSEYVPPAGDAEEPAAETRQGNAEEDARALREALLSLQRMSGAA